MLHNSPAPLQIDDSVDTPPVAVSTTPPAPRSRPPQRPRQLPDAFAVANELAATAATLIILGLSSPLVLLYPLPMLTTKNPDALLVGRRQPESVEPDDIKRCMDRFFKPKNGRSVVFGADAAHIPTGAYFSPLPSVEGLVGLCIEVCSVCKDHPNIMVQVLAVVPVRKAQKASFARSVDYWVAAACRHGLLKRRDPRPQALGLRQ